MSKKKKKEAQAEQAELKAVPDEPIPKEDEAVAQPCVQEEPPPPPVSPTITIDDPKIVLVKKDHQAVGHRIEVRLGTNRSFTGAGIFSCKKGADKVKFFKGTTVVNASGDVRFDSVGQGIAIEIEGTGSSLLEGVHLSWKLETGAEPVVPDAATEKITVVDAKLDLYKKNDTTALTAEEKHGDGRVLHKQNAGKTFKRAKLAVTYAPPELSGTLTISAIEGNVSLFSSKNGGSEIVLPKDITVGPDLGPFEFWAEGKTVSAAKVDTGFNLEIKDLAEGPGKKADYVKLTVMETELELYTSPDTGTPVKLGSDAKQAPGRLLLIQDATFQRKRTKVAVIKKPKDAPCKISLKAASGAGRITVFPAAHETHASGETATALPKDIAPTDITDEAKGMVFWIDGKDFSTAVGETVLQIDVDGVDDACDKIALTVVDLRAANGTDPAPRFLPNKNAHNEPGNHHKIKVKLEHKLGAGATQWSSTSTKFVLADQTTDIVSLTSTADPSASLDAEVLKVVFTPSGKTALPTIEHKMTVVKVVFAESDNQSYGYDDMNDGPRTTEKLHHVSVKKNGTTKVKVTIEGGATSEMIDFKSEDTAKAEFTAPGNGLANFDLTLQGKNQEKAEVTINARVNGQAGPICDGINVDVYKEKVVNISVALVKDPRYAATNLSLAFDAAATQTEIRKWYKRAVAKININDRGTIEAEYDTAGNGALDIRAGGGASVDVTTAKTAVGGAGIRVIIVRQLSWQYFLGADASIGDLTIEIGNGTMRFLVDGGSYPLGSGANRERITVQSKVGRTVTLASPLTKDHTTAEFLQWPLSGLSGDPIWVQEKGKDVDMVRRTIAHEVGHSALRYTDVTDLTNMMHFSASRTDTRLRYLELPKKYTGGNEKQWDECNRT